jgi:phosphosulfolactate synthase
VKDLTKYVNQIFKISEVERTEKPRNEGITVIIDTGQGINATQDLLETASKYIDYCKMGWATWLIMPENIIKKKLKLYHNHDIQTLSGGSALEAAILTGKLEEFLEKLGNLGFTAIEISTGIIDISTKEKSKLVKNVKKMGFKTIITEVGRKSKEEDANLDISDRIQQIKSDLNSGADYVTIEARESGIGIGPYDEEGKVKEPFVEKIANQIMAKKIIWEAPLKSQQLWLITRFGPNPNLGNIKPTEVIPLETLRLGLRGDTMTKFLTKNRPKMFPEREK